MSNIKKIVVGLMSFAILFGGAAMVTGEEDNDLLDRLQELMDEMDQIEEALGEDVEDVEEEEEEPTETVAIEGIPEDFTFTRALSTGSRGEDVKYLQILLNADEATQLAETGAGSPGNETEYYGPITANAVTRFQEKYAGEVLEPLGLTAGTGYFGNSSMQKANAILADEEIVTEPEDEVMALLSEVTERLDALAERVAAIEDPVGEEGTFEVDASPDIYDAEVGPNSTGVEVAQFDFEAEDSDIELQRVDVEFYASGEIETDTDLHTFLDTVYLYHNDEEIASVDVDRNVSRSGEDGRAVRFTGLGINIEEDTTESIVVVVDAEDHDIVDEDENEIRVSIEEDGARGIDAAHVYQYNSERAEVTFDAVDEIAAELEVELSDASPEEGTVEIDEDGITYDIPFAIFDITVEDGDVELGEVQVELVGLDSGEIARVRAYYEGTHLDSKTGDDVDSPMDFEIDWELLEEDATGELEITVDVKDAAGGESGEVAVREIEYYDVNLEEYKTKEDIDVFSEMLTFDNYFPEISNETTSISRSTWSEGSNDRAEGYIEFDVTAHGGDATFLGGELNLAADDNEGQNEALGFTFDDSGFGLDWINIESTVDGDDIKVVMDTTGTERQYVDVLGEVMDAEVDGVSGETWSGTDDNTSGHEVGDLVFNTADYKTYTVDVVDTNGETTVVDDSSEGYYYYEGDGNIYKQGAGLVADYDVVDAYEFTVEEGDTETFTVYFETAEEPVDRLKVIIEAIEWMDEEGDLQTLDGKDVEDLETDSIRLYETID